MDIADFGIGTLTDIIVDLKRTDDISFLEEKYSVSIPQWLTIEYRCRECTKKTRMRIQSKNIKQANRILICPFCRKSSGMDGIYIQKDFLSKKDFEL